MDNTFISQGEYSCLRVDLLFAHQLSFFLVTVYVPCSMTVSVSWMSFWLDHKAVWPITNIFSYEHYHTHSINSGSCSCSSGGDNLAGHVNHAGQHTELPATRWPTLK